MLSYIVFACHCRVTIYMKFSLVTWPFLGMVESSIKLRSKMLKVVPPRFFWPASLKRNTAWRTQTWSEQCIYFRKENVLSTSQWDITRITCAWARIIPFKFSFSSSLSRSRVYLKRREALRTRAACWNEERKDKLIPSFMHQLSVREHAVLSTDSYISKKWNNAAIFTQFSFKTTSNNYLH